MTPERSTHPVLFLILFLPMGISNGYVVVTLGYLLAHAGVSVNDVATLVALSLLPQTWKFFGGPLVDTTLSNKTWFVLSATATGVLMTTTAFLPATSPNMVAIDVLVFAFSTASAFNALAADSLMAHATLPEEKGRAGGWSQAGNLGGSGLGGGAGLWLTQHVSSTWPQDTGHWIAQHFSSGWMTEAGMWFAAHIPAASVAGAVVGLACVASSIALAFVKEPEAEHRAERFVQSLANVGRDVWSVARSRAGLLALVAMSLPISVGAMTNLWAAVAGDWHASADAVALVNGALGGVISMVGCIVGGWLCDKMDRKLAFNLFSIVLAASAVAMAVVPRTQAMFIDFSCLYQFITGFCFAAFGAVVLEAIGKGAAATKYNILAGVANVPIIYLTKIDGWAQTRWGSTAMLLTEAAVAVAGTGVFVLFALATRRFFPRQAAIAPT